MEVSVQELEKWEQGSYRLIDMRSAESLNYGTIPGAEHIDVERLCMEPPENDGRRLVLVFARGQFSLDAAEALEALGYEAYSLAGGYLAWLRRQMEKQNADELCSRVETSLRKRFREKIWCNFTKAVRQYELVQPGDRIAVCISGGKDSMLMAKLFQELKLHNKFPFELRFVVMDPGYSPANRQIIEENARRLHIPVEIFESDIFDSVYNVEKSPCYLCARMRRTENGCSFLLAMNRKERPPMTKKKTPQTIEECNAELELTQKKIRQYENRSKMLDRRLAIEKRKERNHRLCSRGGFIESIVPELITMTDEDAQTFFRLALTSEPAREFLRKRAEETTS